MTHEQLIEIEKGIQCLKDARIHLDNAMYKMMPPLEEDKQTRVRAFYDAICKALDLMYYENNRRD